MDYTVLSLADVRTQLDEITRETLATFCGFDARQLNWRPDERQWSVAQCFQHLLTTNRLMFGAAEHALDDARGRSFWERLPVLPGIVGRMMIRSQAPDATRKFTAPIQAQPSTDDIAADIITRFVEQQRDAIRLMQALNEQNAACTIMTSPFLRVVTYSVLDAWRLVVAHERRHFEQARRVTLFKEFPNS